MHGHRFDDILGYTLAQVRGFSEAIVRQEAERDAQLLSLITLGSRGQERALDKAFDRLIERANQD
ncbi:conserved hypothetical protein [Gammaproteobacteria bacterium]